jgi:predicted RNA-binding protein with PUA-like domain
MAYWLVKSEPEKWSWAQHLEKGVEGWDGVRNYQAANNMKAMRLGDLAYFYHSRTATEVVGVLEVVREYYPDDTDASGRFGMVDFKALHPLPRPVTLKEIKADSRLADIALVRQSRLSVMPLDETAWHVIAEIAENGASTG